MTNPFNARLLENLSGNTFTPGIFRQKASNTQNQENTTPRSVRWSIEHMAVLKPMHFDEKIVELQDERHDPYFEEKAHSAIDNYWKNAHYAPSPDGISCQTPKSNSNQTKQIKLDRESLCDGLLPNSVPVNLTSPGAKSSKFSTELDRLDETLNDQGLDGKEIEKVSDDEIMQNVFSDVIVAGHKADDADVFDTVTDYSHFSDVLKDPSRADFWGCAEWGRKNSGSFFAEEEFLETEQKGAEH